MGLTQARSASTVPVVATRTRPAPLLLVANANASGLRGARSVDAVRSLLRGTGAAVETRLTATVGELADALPLDPERRVVLLGGDGSVHAVANLPGPLPELALIPAGGANNVAVSLGIPTDPRRAAETAATGVARAVDAIEARADGSRHVAVEGVSVGYLALARSGFDAPNSMAVRAALRSGLRTLARFRPFAVTVEADGVTNVFEMSQLFVANLPRYAFGLRVAPDAVPDDGLLDVVVVGPRGRLALPALLPRIRRGTHVGRAGIRTLRARRVVVDARGASPVVADSANLGRGRVELAAMPAALRLVVPR